MGKKTWKKDLQPFFGHKTKYNKWTTGVGRVGLGGIKMNDMGPLNFFSIVQHQKADLKEDKDR